jgi:4-hydroxybenzoate polyprenyltransferase
MVPSLAGGDPVAWWLPVVGALLGVGAHLVNVLPDLDDDAATGVHGLPHRIAARWGTATVTRVAVLLFVAGTALLLVVVPAGGARWLTGGLVGMLAITALRGSGRTPFRVAIAIALVDVALLAWAI